MRYLLAGIGTAALLAAGVGAATTADAAPDPCAEARTALANHRGEQVGLAAAYRISVKLDLHANVAKLGPRMIAGEAETTRLLLAMYGACA